VDVSGCNDADAAAGVVSRVAGHVVAKGCRAERLAIVLLFGRHHPGGGPGMNPTTQPVDPKARWQFSGKLEVDCMICHSADNSHDPAERARQIEIQQNFQMGADDRAGTGACAGSGQDAEDRAARRGIE